MFLPLRNLGRRHPWRRGADPAHGGSRFYSLHFEVGRAFLPTITTAAVLGCIVQAPSNLQPVDCSTLSFVV